MELDAAVEVGVDAVLVFSAVDALAGPADAVEVPPDTIPDEPDGYPVPVWMKRSDNWAGFR